MKKVQNGPLTRLIRTIGYLLILVSSLVISVTALNLLNVGFITTNILPVTNFIDNNLEKVTTFKYLILTVGLIVLMWTQSKSLFFRIFNTILVTLSVIVIAVLDKEVFGFIINNSGLQTMFTDLVTKFEWFKGAIFLIPLFFVYLLLAYKKPARISTQVITSGLMFLVIVLIGSNIQHFLNATWLSSNIYLTVLEWMKAIGFTLVTVGSAFGVLGFLRK